MTNGSEVIASELMTALLVGEDVTIPVVDLSGSEFNIPGDNTSAAYAVLNKLSNADMTTGSVGGTGTFDVLMRGVAAQLKGEYESNRITGTEYAKTYIALTQAALASATQYLLGRDAAYWQAVQAQAASVTARVQLATAKIQNAAAKLEAMNVKANYALAKLKLSTMDIEYATGKYNLDNILPAQNILLTDQHNQTIQQTSNLATEQDNMIKQGTLIDSQKIGQDNQNATSAYNLENILPSQLAQTNAQTSLLSYDLTTVKPAEVANLNKQGTLLDSQKLGQDKQNETAIYNLENLLPVQLATASAQKLSIDKANSISDYNLATVLPSQVSMTNAQKLGQDKQTETANYNLINLLPKQVDLLNEQIAGAVKDTETKTYTLNELMPVQKLSLREQAEAQRGQTMDTRSDGITPIAGSIGKQNSLYTQQVVSYQKDSQLKAAKVFSDVWITCRSIDEGFPLPTQFDTAATQAAMQAIITANDLG